MADLTCMRGDSTRPVKGSDAGIVVIGGSVGPSSEIHGERARNLHTIAVLGAPVPLAVALPFSFVSACGSASPPDMSCILEQFPEDTLLALKSSPQKSLWGGPEDFFDIGFQDTGNVHGDINISRRHERLASRFVACGAGDDAAPAGLSTDMPRLPGDRATQLNTALTMMVQAWGSPSARLVRTAHGAPPDAGLGIIVQAMIEGGAGHIRTGSAQAIDPNNGTLTLHIQQRDYMPSGATSPTWPSRVDTDPGLTHRQTAELKVYLQNLRHEWKVEPAIDFTLNGDQMHVIDCNPAILGNRAAINSAVSLARDGIISRKEAVLRVAPESLRELLHSQVAAEDERDVIGQGVGASPGAASGKIVFSIAASEIAHSRNEAAILVRRETSVEDIRGMHSASAILTERGGKTSHAAVVARGLGLPCVVGISNLVFDFEGKSISARDGRQWFEGDVLTVDGNRGEILAGTHALIPACPDAALATLLDWADSFRRIEVRANADTPADVANAKRHRADGIGLCRTEHMLAQGERLQLVRRLILADDISDRDAALAELLPLQRADFVQIFRMMAQRPVCIRLLDPPLHDFLPREPEAIKELACSLQVPVDKVASRISALEQFNPMLGLRGVRLGLVMPEIYAGQIRAILEAAAEAGVGKAIAAPEIMIPLVSDEHEVEQVCRVIAGIADQICRETGTPPSHSLGVMVETPRAALRSGHIARHVSFLSFGTNDLTQMTWGLSRDDSSSFMPAYVRNRVIPADPFHDFDRAGVGELVRLAVKLARETNTTLRLSACGEHAGQTQSIDFFCETGFDYISCSPFRVPATRLAAAQWAIRQDSECRDTTARTSAA